MALLLLTEPWVALLTAGVFLGAGFFIMPVGQPKGEASRENDDSGLFIDVGPGPGRP